MTADPAGRGGDAYAVRRYRPGDERRIIELFERTFGRTMGPSESERHWRWEFADNPAAAVAILLAEHGDTLAAQYAVLPTSVWVDGTERRAALSLDTATDAGHRGKGLFPRLARQLYAEIAGEGYVAVFGFPNRQSAPSFFGKLEWVELAPFPLLLKPLRGAAGAALRARFPAWGAMAPLAELGTALLRRGPRRIPAGLAFERAASIPADADDLWRRARDGKRVCVVRDRRYLEWRYVARPESAYRVELAREAGRLVGYVVTVVEERMGLPSGFVMDLLCEESRPDVAAALVSRAETVLAADGARLLSALMYPGGAAHRALREAGFRRVPRRLFPQDIHFGVRPLASPDLAPALREPAHWYLGWGDSDVV